ncbi:hypothetical protein [Manganibacter manganicus]|uniref:Uncharacterized protein n=1 Tax=Manganibacter manganicus TaxID=1873176 RepID=A0A1V8RTI9_9HYPH|nr:hypothetical protein [Pseudaminobacter manganicus]OQM76444.1 hypothetical protein BFN67_13740 [Pseudaminobacter manganicus]
MSAAYTLDDLQIDVWDLHRLLITTYDIIHEMPYERDGKRDDELDRVASMLRVARDFSERISVATDTHYHSIRNRGSEAPTRMTGEGRNG